MFVFYIYSRKKNYLMVVRILATKVYGICSFGPCSNSVDPILKVKERGGKQKPKYVAFVFVLCT